MNFIEAVNATMGGKVVGRPWGVTYLKLHVKLDKIFKLGEPISGAIRVLNDRGIFRIRLEDVLSEKWEEVKPKPEEQ